MRMLSLTHFYAVTEITFQDNDRSGETKQYDKLGDQGYYCY